MSVWDEIGAFFGVVDRATTTAARGVAALEQVARAGVGVAPALPGKRKPASPIVPMLVTREVYTRLERLGHVATRAAGRPVLPGEVLVKLIGIAERAIEERGRKAKR